MLGWVEMVLMKAMEPVSTKTFGRTVRLKKFSPLQMMSALVHPF